MASHHFQVTQKVHATAVSQIYEAVSPDGCRSFLEVLHASSAGSWLDAFRRDLAAAAQLRHPCLLEVLEIGAQPDGSPVIIYERPVGISLGRWLARGHVAPTDAAMDLLAGLAHALGCLHDAGVSHGALTADDVMLVEISQHALGFPRLRGFGYRWLRAASVFDGAPTMSPGQRTVPAARREIAADIAALAALADRLLTPLRASPQITSVIRAATLLGEDGRFATPAAFLEALEAALDPHAPAADELTDPTLKMPWGVRHRGLRRVLVTAAATLVLGAGVHALVSAHNAHSVTVSPAPPPAVPPPVLVQTPPPAEPPPVVAPAPIPPPVVKAPAAPVAPAARPTKPAPLARAPKLSRVWSQRENRLIYVDEQGQPVDPPASDPN